MSAPLTNDLMTQLQGAPLQQISQQLGLSPAQAKGAIGAALPLLIGALGRNAGQPDGAQSLFGALQRDHAGAGGLDDLLGAALGGGGQGDQILGHIFGARQPVAAQGLGAAAGLDGRQSSQLLKLLAPIVMAYLAKRLFASRNAAAEASPDALSQVLGAEQRELRQQDGVGSLLGTVLDRDGDGDTDLSDLAGLAGKFLGGR